MERKYGWASSSINPQKLSLTLKGLIPLVIFILPLIGIVDVTPDNLGEIVDGIINIVVLIGTLVSAILSFYGLIRKLFKIGNVK